MADSVREEDPSRRLTISIQYPVIQGDVPAREAVNEQFARMASEMTLDMTPEEPVAADAPSSEAYDFDGGFTVEYIDREVVSVLQSLWFYTGGAHGNIVFLPQTFSLTTGQALALTDVFKTTPEALDVLATAVQDRLITEASARFQTSRGDAGAMLWLDDIQPTPEAFEGRWTLAADSLAFHYAPYEVSPYAAGTWRVPVAYSDLAPHLGPAAARLAAR